MQKKIVTLVIFILMVTTLTVSAETFHVERGEYLWHVWESPTYRENYPSWEDFKSQVAKINNLPNSEQAFRTLPSGFVLTLPSLPGEAESARRIVDLEQKQTLLDIELATARAEVEAKGKEIIELAERARTSSIKTTAIVAITVLLILTAAGLVMARKQHDESKRDKVRMNGQIRTLENQKEELASRVRILNFYAEKYLVEVAVPKDIGRLLGNEDTRVLLPKAEPIEGEMAVIFPKKGPVKLKNVNRYLDNADPETLQELGLNPARVM